MISCQPPLITLRLYLSLVCSPNLFLSLLTQLPPLSPENFFFSTPHPSPSSPFPILSLTPLSSLFPCPVLLCSLWTPDEGRGFFDEGLSKLTTPRSYRPHVFYNASLEAFSRFLRAPQLVTEEIYCLEFEEEMNAALVPF